ncbi:unnamed protein product [Rotaria sp. Silwood2]|nr:unnamed protein product [Rotaria sp. Silwood2]CAF2713467.1 unnamed protein product [Rotaria sp. Silwood2]CAF2898476.1 unnamed protein product [Rotaria sp. Silwood2]CAF3125220.1 unnamed protein product [Rotaria sp. Silwood2]CAF3891971.1 unnamed protein product [Rotaria sp. Silwood2]
MNTTIIDQQCNLLLDQSSNSTKNDKQLNEFFNIVTGELTKYSLMTTDFNIITKIVNTLISIDKNKLCKQSQLNKHKLLIILRNYLIKFFFNQEKNELINKLSILFHNICYGCVLTDEIVQLFIYKSLIDEICLFFNEIEKHSNETKLIEIVNRLLEIFQRIQMIRFDLHKNSILELLFITIAKCIISNFFIKKLENLPKNMLELNAIETLLFDRCIEFMYWQPYENNILQRKYLSTICETLLRTTINLMSSSLLSEPVIQVACLLSLNIMVMDNTTDENIIDSNYYHIIDHCISMLDQHGTTITKRTLLSTLCHLTYNIDMIVYMKNNLFLKSLLLKMSESDDSEISFNTYRILSIIMNEEDIKRLANGNKIVALFYLYFISMIDDPIQKTAFHSLLHSLKSLAQHEQIKIELINQGTIPLLIRCVIEEDFHKTKIQQYALEILLALSFNKDTLNILEQDTNFINYIKTLENSTEENIQRAANHLLWQFDQKMHSFSVTESDSSCSNLKFDIMLSYSHSDKKICFQIYENLIKDGFHVWLDRDQMHGDTMTAMANAIENSEFVFICMSEAYKQSPFCQAEAQYAFERRCKLIPLIMKAKYKPDGWLGIIVSGKIYVDFSKFEFDSAYSILRNEIEKKRNTTIIHSKTITKSHKLLVPQSSSLSVVDQHQVVIDLPHCIDSWSIDHVRSFLIDNNFTSLLPVFPDFNGCLLRQAYLMCQINRESMFQSMRHEVIADGTIPPLTLATYLRFLEQLKKYIPINNNESSQTSMSAICNVM